MFKMTETTDGVEVSSCEQNEPNEPAETDNLVAKQEPIIATKKQLTEKEDSSVFSLPEKPPPDDEEDIHAAVVVPPADGGWGWVVVASSFVCNFFVDGIIFSFGVYLEQMKVTLDANTAEVALVGSLLAGCYLLAGTSAHSFMQINLLHCGLIFQVRSSAPWPTNTGFGW